MVNVWGTKIPWKGDKELIIHHSSYVIDAISLSINQSINTFMTVWADHTNSDAPHEYGCCSWWCASLHAACYTVLFVCSSSVEVGSQQLEPAAAAAPLSPPATASSSASSESSAEEDQNETAAAVAMSPVAASELSSESSITVVKGSIVEFKVAT